GTDLFPATDNGVQRHEYILAKDGAIHEGTRIVPFADFHAGLVRRDQGTGDAVIRFILVTEQVLWIMQFEGQSDYRGDWRQRDPALGKGQADAQRFLSLVFFSADDAVIGQGTGVGAHFRAGQPEAGDFTAVDQP